MSTKGLAACFRAQSQWRERKAEKYPEDRRNAQSAAALRALADFVGAPDRHGEHESALEAHLSTDGLEFAGQRAQRTVARYGYGYSVVGRSHEAFLEELLALCLHDAYEAVSGNASGFDPTGSLWDFEVSAAVDGVVLDGGYWMRRAQGRVLIDDLAKWVQEVRDHESRSVGDPCVKGARPMYSDRAVSGHQGGVK